MIPAHPDGPSSSSPWPASRDSLPPSPTAAATAAAAAPAAAPTAAAGWQRPRAAGGAPGMRQWRWGPPHGQGAPTAASAPLPPGRPAGLGPTGSVPSSAPLASRASSRLDSLGASSRLDSTPRLSFQGEGTLGSSPSGRCRLDSAASMAGMRAPVVVRRRSIDNPLVPPAGASSPPPGRTWAEMQVVLRQQAQQATPRASRENTATGAPTTRVVRLKPLE